jgi:hypothetical protein
MRSINRIGCLLVVLLIGTPSAGHPGLVVSQPNIFRNSASPAAAAGADFTVHLPLIQRDNQIPRVNVPHFAVADIGLEHYDEMAVFWLGRVTPTENYADVRIAYSESMLELRLGIIDRRLWYDTTPSPADLATWDAATVFLDLDGEIGIVPDQDISLLASELSLSGTNRSNRQAAYRGDGSGWTPAAVPFTTVTPGPPWRGGRWFVEAAVQAGVRPVVEDVAETELLSRV